MDHDEMWRRVEACLELLAREVGVSSGATRRGSAWAVIAAINDEIGTLCEIIEADASGATARYRGAVPPAGAVSVSCVLRGQPGPECTMKVQHAEFERDDRWLVRLARDEAPGRLPSQDA